MINLPVTPSVIYRDDDEWSDGADLFCKSLDSMSNQLAAVLEVYEYEPGPTQRGSNAGDRGSEGLNFKAQMRTLLKRDRHIIETACGKSSNGVTLDGNASERISFKMLRFKRDPRTRDTLVIALNAAFSRYANAVLPELRSQAAYLNKIKGPQILVLSLPEHYAGYLEG